MRYDTVVIGGGIAGLQAAIQLARSLRRVLVIDRREGRSLIAKNYRNILGYPDGVSGEQLRLAGERHAYQLGVEFQIGTVAKLTQDEEGLFRVFKNEEDTFVEAKTIVLATGITDPFPAIPGLLPCLGESIFICPDCDGYEIVGKQTAIVGNGPNTAEMAKLLRYFTESLVIVNHTGTQISESDQEFLRTSDIPVYQSKVTEFKQSNGNMKEIKLTSGELLYITKAFLAFPGARVNTELLHGFNVAFLENGHALVNPRTKETDHRNIWVVGDVAVHSQQVSIAMGDGSQAAIWIHKRLRE